MDYSILQYYNIRKYVIWVRPVGSFEIQITRVVQHHSDSVRAAKKKKKKDMARNAGKGLLGN